MIENIHSAIPLYLLVNHESGYIEEKNGNKSLIFGYSVNKIKKYFVHRCLEWKQN